MPVTIKVNGTCLTLVHKFSNGISTATIPDICKTPTPGGPIPIPYPNIAQSITLSDGTTTVKGDKVMAANKGSKFSLSNGDNAGTVGGVKSNVFMKEATWILYSFDVKMDGKNACRLTDPMYHNHENTVNLAGVAQPSLVVKIGNKELADKLCDAACKAMEDKKKADKKLKKGQAPTRYQKFMRNRLDPKPRGSNPPFLTEVGQRVTTRGGGEFIGRWGPATSGGRPFVKWDVILTYGKKAAEKGSLVLDKVRRIVEVKFPGDSPTTNQADMIKKMGRKSGKNMRKKFVKMEVAKDCVCT
jgi:hypothetical protein